MPSAWGIGVTPYPRVGRASGVGITLHWWTMRLGVPITAVPVFRPVFPASASASTSTFATPAPTSGGGASGGVSVYPLHDIQESTRFVSLVGQSICTFLALLQ